MIVQPRHPIQPLTGNARRVLLVFCALAIASTGCDSKNSDRIDISGRVTYAGQPVPKGRIDFLPDPKQGGLGPAGYAMVVDGKFDTSSAGRGPVPGPQLVRIAGFSDEAATIDEVSHGKPLFDIYETTIRIDAEQRALNFDIPANASR